MIRIVIFICLLLFFVSCEKIDNEDIFLYQWNKKSNVSMSVFYRFVDYIKVKKMNFNETVTKFGKGNEEKITLYKSYLINYDIERIKILVYKKNVKYKYLAMDTVNAEIIIIIFDLNGNFINVISFD